MTETFVSKEDIMSGKHYEPKVESGYMYSIAGYLGSKIYSTVFGATEQQEPELSESLVNVQMLEQ